MKMVKSLLLGSAAGLVAVAGAQAADLPVKAKPVQYVKICSLYGAGFYYIPGTDTCLKVGGWVRQYLGVNANGNLTNGYLGSGNVNTRASNNGWNWKARGYITADARTQTEFGTLRSYISVGGSTQGRLGQREATGVGWQCNRAFIQLAGFTFGVAQSFYDLYPTPALSYFGGMINPSSDTGDGGQTVYGLHRAVRQRPVGDPVAGSAAHHRRWLDPAASLRPAARTIVDQAGGRRALSGRRGQPAYGRLMGRRPDHGWYP